MNPTFKLVAGIVIFIALFLGVRYVGSVIHYGCINPAEDCPPPILGVAEIGFYLTGGTLNPLWNRDATTVMKVDWIIEESDAATREQRISADVTTVDGNIKRHELGVAHGCAGESMNVIEDRKLMFGKVDCYFAASGVKFAAFFDSGAFRIERYDESAMDGSIKTTVLVEIH